MGSALLGGGRLSWPMVSLQGALPYEVATAALIVVAALAVALTPSRLGAIAALGVVGYLVALLYVLYSGPDLALTQLLVETLTVILLLLVFHFLPRLSPEPSPRRTHIRDIAVSAGVGATAARSGAVRGHLPGSGGQRLRGRSQPARHLPHR
ncbi:MAG: DUF4040 domain-containing protein [Chloroflexi bacterium]|nr:DUF4040 domain-containing protein [Chloroflexota bacterium]